MSSPNSKRDAEKPVFLPSTPEAKPRGAEKTGSWDAEGPTEYEKLTRFIRWHRGRFALGLVRVNFPLQRDGIIASLRDELAREGIRLVCVDLGHHAVRSLLQELETNPDIQQAIRADAPSVAFALIGLERSIETPPHPRRPIPYFLASLNLERDALTQRFSFPITFWLTDLAMDRVAADAPDFFDYRSNVFVFRMARPDSLASATPSRGETAAARESQGGVSPELLAERRDLLQARLDELKHKAELTPAEHKRVAELYLEMGELDLAETDTRIRGRAVSSLAPAQRLFYQLRDKAGEARAFEKMGDAHYWIDEYDAAREKYEQALPIYREIGDRLGEANALRSLGDVFLRRAEYDAAREKYEQALSIYREIGDRLGEANALRALGHLARSQKDLVGVQNLYAQALTIAQAIGDRLGIANTLWGQAQTYKLQKDTERTRTAFAQAQRIYQDIGDAKWAERCRQEIEALRRAESGVLARVRQSLRAFWR